MAVARISAIALLAGALRAVEFRPPAGEERRLVQDIHSDQRLRIAKELFNETWTYLVNPARTPEDDERMLNTSYASAYFWATSGGPENRARSQWQLSRVWVVLGHSDPGAYHARRCLTICEENDLHGWDRPFAFEALARAADLRGDATERDRWLNDAKHAGASIAEAEDREQLESELATIPGWSAIRDS